MSRDRNRVSDIEQMKAAAKAMRENAKAVRAAAGKARQGAKTSKAGHSTVTMTGNNYGQIATGDEDQYMGVDEHGDHYATTHYGNGETWINGKRVR